jgi:hypothetical protein
MFREKGGESETKSSPLHLLTYVGSRATREAQQRERNSEARTIPAMRTCLYHIDQAA